MFSSPIVMSYVARGLLAPVTLDQRLAKLPDFRDEFRRVLDQVESLGLNWQRTRFGRYLEYVEQAAAVEYPRGFDLWGDLERNRRFFEAASQAQQLIDSVPVWASTTKTILREKIKGALGGAAVPPAGSEWDHARNTLLELTTAGLLHSRGFAVRVGGVGAEDAEARVADLAPFAIECKRPASLRGLPEAVRGLRRQFKTRVANGYTHGFGVVGIDRVIDLAGAVRAARDTEHLTKIIKGKTERIVHETRRMMNKPASPFFPAVPIGAAVLSGAVFVLNVGVLYTVSFMGLFCTGPDDHEITRRLVDTIQPLLEAPRWP